MKILLEIAVDTVAGGQVAVAAGADRIELCAALSDGGLTPSAGQMHEAARLPVPVFAMIRPRGGDFVYTADETKVMQRDIETARQAGMAGLVFGALRRDGTLDADALADMLTHCGDLPVTLHRAFDLVADQFAALEEAITLGFRRILTSGQAVDAATGVSRLTELVRCAGSRISIMPGAGIRASNAAMIIATSGAREIHAACRIANKADAGLSALGFIGATGDWRTDPDAVAELRWAAERTQTERVLA